MHRKFLIAETQSQSGNALGARQIRIIASTRARDRAGDIVEPRGALLENYKRNPVILRDHNPSLVVGSAEIAVFDDRIEAIVTFSPEGISPEADKACAQAKAGDLRGASIGLDPIEAEPLSGGGYHIIKWELLEISLVAIPCNQQTLVVEKAHSMSQRLKVGASCGLPLASHAVFDEAAAAKSIFNHAGLGTDDPDLGFIRKGFLVYDDAAKDRAASYRIPFAAVEDGRLVASAAGLKAARVALASADIADDLRAKAEGVLRIYEGKTQKNAAPRIKDLYDLADVAQLLQSLGYAQSESVWEAEYEGDGSKVPAMLGEACRALGDALIAMTQEEVAELLASIGPIDGDKTARSSFAKVFAAARRKAGAEFSTANKNALRDACKSIAAGHDAIKALLDDDAVDQDFDHDADKAVSVAAAKAARLRELDLLILRGVA